MSYFQSECLTDQVFQMRWAYLYEAGCWVSPLFKVLLSVLLLDLQSKARAKNTLHPHPPTERKQTSPITKVQSTDLDWERLWVCSTHLWAENYRTIDESESDRPLRGFTGTHTVRSQTHHKNHHSTNSLPGLTKMLLVISSFLLKDHKSPIARKWDQRSEIRVRIRKVSWNNT